MTQLRWVVIGLLPLVLTGCPDDMRDRGRMKPFEPSPVFSDGRSARPLVPGTVARGQLRDDEPFYTGKQGGRFVTEVPFPVTRALLERGQERYNIYCAVCHDRTGAGNGMVVQRGFPRPPSYHTDRLRNQPVGYFYDVATNGFGRMAGYAAQTSPEDRWAIAAFTRALQFSQNADVRRLAPQDRAKLGTQ